jgi:hypothetical protein
MSIDHKKIFAAASASFCVRSSLASALLCCGVLGAGAAHADGPDGAPRRDGPPPQQQQGNTARKTDARNDPRSLDNYEARAEEQRRQMQEAGRNAEMNRRMGRMTPDERRDLRRQINEVGQDLYALPPRR